MTCEYCQGSGFEPVLRVDGKTAVRSCRCEAGQRRLRAAAARLAEEAAAKDAKDMRDAKYSRKVR